MKVVIFADKSHSFVKPKADGLCKTIKDMGHDVELWYDGNYWLQKVSIFKAFFVDLYRLFLNIQSHKKNLYIYIR